MHIDLSHAVPRALVRFVSASAVRFALSVAVTTPQPAVAMHAAAPPAPVYQMVAATFACSGNGCG